VTRCETRWKCGETRPKARAVSSVLRLTEEHSLSGESPQGPWASGGRLIVAYVRKKRLFVRREVLLV
jgi:hypothetical protein